MSLAGILLLMAVTAVPVLDGRRRA
jgi:hypothetical protein